MRDASRRLIVLILLVLYSGQLRAAEIRTLVPDFHGDSALGRSVATILDLQLWRTLQANRTKGVGLGTGTVVRLSRTLDQPTHEVAETEAKKLDINAQLVLWGEAFAIGDRALVTAHLTLADYFDFRKRKKEIWNLRVTHSGEDFSLTADVPQRRYEFEPLALPSDFIEKYSTPRALPILANAQEGSRRLAYLGTVYRHCGSRGDYACVTSAGKKGWVYLPQLGKHKPEIVDFIGAVVRIYRGDWEGSIELFRRVIDNPTAPVNLVIDSHLYIIRAKTELNLAADAEINAVMAITFPSRSVVQYTIMHLIHRCFAEETEACSGSDRVRLVDLVLKNRALFDQNDAWYIRAQRLLNVAP